MKLANELVRQARQQLNEVETSLHEHPYPAAIETGTLPIEGLTPFIGHQYHLSLCDIQSVALLVNHFGDQPIAQFFNGLLEGEFAGRSGILLMGKKQGLNESALQNFEPVAEGFAYGAYLNFLASHGSAAEVMSGLLLNMTAWGYNCGRISQGLRKHYGWNSQDTAFLDSFAELPSFEDEAFSVIQEGLDRGESAQRMIRAARLIQGYEKMFWDAMASWAKQV